MRKIDSEIFTKEYLYVNVNPKAFRVRLNSYAANHIEPIEREKDKELERLSSGEINKEGGGVSKIIGGITFLSFCLGFFICGANCMESNSIGYWIGTTAIGFAFSLFVALLYELGAQRGNDKISKDKDIVGEDANNKIKVINSEVERIYSEYCIAFEEEVQKQSVIYAESKLAQEVITWMTKGFDNTIKSAKRDSYIKGIKVPFEFSVYRDKITCPLGIYDFEKKRCSFLETQIEQAALARALSSQIQLNIVMSYTKDPSGTIPKITWTNEYESDCSKSKILYEAINGFYETVKQWG